MEQRKIINYISTYTVICLPVILVDRSIDIPTKPLCIKSAGGTNEAKLSEVTHQAMREHNESNTKCL